MHLISPALNCDDTCKVLSSREAPQQLSGRGFHWGLVTWAPFAEHVPQAKLPDSQEESECSAETILFAQTAWNSELLINDGMLGTLPRSKFLDASEGPIL